MGIKLQLNNLIKVFGNLVAVNELCIDILDGEFVSIVGPSGCGKTTTLNMLAGVLEPTSGSIILDGIEINSLPARKRDIGLIFQDYAIFDKMDVYENLAFSLRTKKTPKEQIDRTVRSVAETFNLTGILHNDPSFLNPGDLQRVAIARTVITEPSVFLLDEPLDNLDANMRVTMRGELKRLQKDLGKTMIYVTHDQEEAMSLADRVVVMNNGKLQQFDTPKEIYDHPVNKVVAGFIGNLPMNFIDSQLRDESGKLILTDSSQSFHLDISSHRKVIEESHCGETLCLGVRPEHISAEPSKEHDSPFKAVVYNLEILGAENVIEFYMKEKPDIIHRMIAPPEFVPKVNDTISIHFHPDKIYLIDPGTGNVLRQ